MNVDMNFKNTNEHIEKYSFNFLQDEKIEKRWIMNFFSEERTRKNEHGFSFFEAVKVHIRRISIFLQTKNVQTRTDS